MTANGEIFSQDSMTAAHKSIALGSYVLVTNLSNDSSVILRVNDRMPKWNKRSIDLSFTAAEKLNYVQKGLTKVRIEVIPPPEQEEPAPNPGPLAVERVQPSKSKTVFKVPGRQIFLKRPVIIYHTAYKQMGRWKLFSRASND
jgi:rare lipoprotein A (peptidoglycan hydrolase)